MATLLPKRAERLPGTAQANAFEQIVPEIYRYMRSATNRQGQRLRHRSMARALAHASDIFHRLGDHGLSDLAYPRPLAMAALVRLRQTGC